MPKISDLTQKSLLNFDDFVTVVDTQDLTFGPTGTNKKMLVTDFFKTPGFLFSSKDTIVVGSLASPTILDGWTVDFNNPFVGYDAISGGAKNLSGFDIPLMFGTIQLKPVVVSGNKCTVFLYSEHSIDNGSTWIRNDDSLREFNLSSETRETISVPSLYRNFINGSIVRFMICSDGDVELQTPSATIGGVLTNGFSAVWELSTRA
jgi:hypothetical protein